MTSKCDCVDNDFLDPYDHDKLFDGSSAKIHFAANNRKSTNDKNVSVITADTTTFSSFESPNEKLNHELVLLEPDFYEICESARGIAYNNSTISQRKLEFDIHDNFASQIETVGSSTNSGKCETKNKSEDKALWTRPYSSPSSKNSNLPIYQTTTTYQPFYKSRWAPSTRALCTHEPLQESNNENREYSGNLEIRSYNETNGNGKHICTATETNFSTDPFHQLPSFDKSLNKSKSKSVGILNTAWYLGNDYQDVYDTKGTHFQNSTSSLYKSAETNTDSHPCTFFSQPSTAEENKENADLTNHRFRNSNDQLFSDYRLENQDKPFFITERSVDNYDLKRNLYQPTDSPAFMEFMKAVPLTGDFDIDEEIFKFYRSKFNGSQYVAN